MRSTDRTTSMETCWLYLEREAAILVLRVDADGVILAANRYARELTGLPLLSGSLRDLLISSSQPPNLGNWLTPSEKPRPMNVRTASGGAETLYVTTFQAGPDLLLFGQLDPQEQERLRCDFLKMNQDQAVQERQLYLANAELARVNEQKVRLAQRLLTQEEDLRRGISSDLHDGIAQVVAALGFNLSYLKQHAPKTVDGNFHDRLEESRTLVKELGTSVRQLMGELRPVVLDDFGLARAVSLYAERQGKRNGFAVEVEAAPDFPRLDPVQELALFRIAQEALSNASRHAQASKVSVSLGCNEGVVRLVVQDDGKGFVPQPAAPLSTQSGWGLVIMGERAASIGGSFLLDAAPGRGTRVVVETSSSPSST